MLDPKDIIAVDRAGFRAGVVSVLAVELTVVALIFADTSKVRSLLANALDSNWTPFNKKTKPNEGAIV